MKRVVKTSLCTLATSLLMIASLTAKAATLSLIGGAVDYVPWNWNPSPTAPGLSVGNTIQTFNAAQAAVGEGIAIDANANIVYTYIGKEAGSTNLFAGSDVRSDSIFPAFLTGFTAPGTTIATTGSSGLLDFSFVGLGTCCVDPGAFINGGGSFGFDAGLNLDDSNLGLSLAVAMISPSSAYLMFGDGFGDADYDDMVVRVDVSAVPLPAAVWLFGTALIGLVGLGKRRKTA
ncbi:MAG: VPLPA-CTERM sorting domain-containing protein [Gammaproteobacteria bacterium]|nr:VPLPA-CTERM sorting domain-containing protein [Gammaproteobacteria bacterium]MDH3448756.1 VPLPA-CTERM sorting domain-containing protein [Gammaproteobacteria bacterium]